MLKEQIEDTSEPEPEKYVEICGICGRHIYEGEMYYDIQGDIICDDSDCLFKYVNNNFRLEAKEK